MSLLLSLPLKFMTRHLLCDSLRHYGPEVPNFLQIEQKVSDGLSIINIKAVNPISHKISNYITRHYVVVIVIENRYLSILYM